MKFRVIGFDVYDIEIPDIELDYRNLYYKVHRLINSDISYDFTYHFSKDGKYYGGYIEDGWKLQEFQNLQKGAYSDSESLRYSCRNEKDSRTDPKVNEAILRRSKNSKIDPDADYVVLYLISYRTYVARGRRFHNNPYGERNYCDRQYCPGL